MGAFWQILIIWPGIAVARVVVVETIDENHRTLKEWKATYGSDTVESRMTK
ncbi:hypothetical protein [Pseudomonas fluorescens]|uniref:hypothetical protein n=1 Tax=Pseudomonas fluorescens TaxID=294 RepID=UPI003F7A5093